VDVQVDLGNFWGRKKEASARKSALFFVSDINTSTKTSKYFNKCNFQNLETDDG
jgi:uncharacterized protein YfaS (alpha-2-macroglobulin family)